VSKASGFLALHILFDPNQHMITVGGVPLAEGRQTNEFYPFP
jgi:hypothetical protein